MSGGKKRSGFQITSVTSDLNHSPNHQAGQSLPSVVQSIQSEASSSCRSSSQPTTPSLKRKCSSHDAPGPGASCSRFRVVRLAGGGERGESYRRGRWTCMEFLERWEGAGFRRVMDSLRHAHSLESLEMIGRETVQGGVHSQDMANLLTQQVSDRAGLLPHSGPPSPTHREPIRIRLLDRKEPIRVQGLDSTPPPPSPRLRNLPPLQLDVDAMGRAVPVCPQFPPSGAYHPILTPVQTPSAFTLDQTMFDLPEDSSVSSNSLLPIDNKIEQAMDLVKSHLMLAVREEVELLKEQIRELQEKNQQLERENRILRALTHNVYTA